MLTSGRPVDVVVTPWKSRIRQSVAATSLGVLLAMSMWAFGALTPPGAVVVAVITGAAVWRFARARVTVVDGRVLRVAGFWRDVEFNLDAVEVASAEAVTLVSLWPAWCLAVVPGGRTFVFRTISTMDDDEVERWLESIEAASVEVGSPSVRRISAQSPSHGTNVQLGEARPLPLMGWAAILEEFPRIELRSDFDQSGTVEFVLVRLPDWNLDVQIWEFGGEIRLDIGGCVLMEVAAGEGEAEVLDLLRMLVRRGFWVSRQARPEYVRVALGSGEKAIGSYGVRLPWRPLEVIRCSPWGASDARD